MRTRKFPGANTVFVLEGGNEDNDLWVEKTLNENDEEILVSVWELDDDEREQIARGGTIELVVWGNGHPPVALVIGPKL